MDKITEQILRRRMHGLYLSRKCEDVVELSRKILGLHCWFHRNVAFSALIRGADLSGWKTLLTKTWLYRGTLHGVAFDELPTLLALHSGESDFSWLGVSEEQLQAIASKVIRLMEDGVYSRAEMRNIFAYEYDENTISRIFSSWGGIFVYLASVGKVAFRSMTSRDFDLISAEPVQSSEEVLQGLLHRFFTAYGPATISDAAWFLGFNKDKKKELEAAADIEELSRFEYNKDTYYFSESGTDIQDIPELTLLSGFDPFIVSYMERSEVLPAEYKKAVILKSGICLPTVAVNGQVAGLWNIKKGEPVLEFFEKQPKRMKSAAMDLVDNMRLRIKGIM